MDTEDLLMDSEVKTKTPKRKFIFFSDLHSISTYVIFLMKKLYLSALASYVQCKFFFLYVLIRVIGRIRTEYFVCIKPISATVL